MLLLTARSQQGPFLLVLDTKAIVNEQESGGFSHMITTHPSLPLPFLLWPGPEIQDNPCFYSKTTCWIVLFTYTLYMSGNLVQTRFIL